MRTALTFLKYMVRSCLIAVGCGVLVGVMLTVPNNTSVFAGVVVTAANEDSVSCGWLPKQFLQALFSKHLNLFVVVL